MMDPYLNRFADVAAGFRSGRNVREGYARGWGIQFGDLRQSVLSDQLYREAAALAEGRSLVPEANRINLFLILKFFLPRIPKGNVIEFGAYQGGNAFFFAHVLKTLYQDRCICALDTFAGMPEGDKTLDAHNAGDFSDVDLSELRIFSQQHRLDNLEFVEGLFTETAPAVLARLGPIALAHIDCDIFSAVAYSYEVVKDYMVEGGYLVFDDATVSSCIGATEVVESLVIRRDGYNCEQIYPHFVFRAAKGGVVSDSL